MNIFKDVQTMEQEVTLIEKILRNCGVILNHNYIRARKGPHPLFEVILSHSMIYKGHIEKYYFLTFTENQLLLLNMDSFDDTHGDQFARIAYSEIEAFKVSQIFGDYCLQFIYNNKKYYFYVSTPTFSSLLGFTDYQLNFQALQDRNFMGLL